MNNISYKNLIMGSPFGVAYHKVVLDDQGKPVDYIFLEVNRAFEKMTGLKSKEIVDKRVTEVLPCIRQGDFDWVEYFGKVAVSGEARDFEQYSEPLKRWYKVFVYSPQYGYFISVFTDTTKERLKLEEVDRFFSINLDLLCIADTDGHFIKVNKSWEDSLGYSIKDLEERKFLSFVHPDDMQATLDALKELQANRPVLNFINRYKSKDGTYRYIEWRSHPYGKLIYSAARDITDRKLTENRLNEARKRLSAAQSFASVGTWEYDVDSRRLFWSKECEALFGLEEGEFEGSFDDFLKRVHPDDRELVISTNKPITERDESTPLEYEHRIIRKDGKVRWVRESAGVLEGTNGEPERIVGFVMDITGKKETEQELQKSESRYRGLVESQIDLIVRVDSENRFTFVNDAYCQTFGKTREELIGQSFAPLVHEDDLPATLEAMKGLSKPPYRCTLAQRAMTMDGWRWIHWEDNAILDGDGNIMEIQGVGRDITELKKAEEELKISETKLKTLLAETPAVVYSYGFKNGVPDLSYINENVEQILGFKPEHFLHDFDTWASCVHPEDLAAIKPRIEDMQKKLHKGQEELFEYRFKDKQGEYHWLSDRQRVLHDQLGNVFVVGVWIDITQEKKNQEAIENEEKLRQIIENLDGVFWLRSADRQQMLYVSDAYERIYGRSKESLKNDPASFMGSMHPDDQERIRSAYKAFLKSGKFNQEYRITRPDGEERWLNSMAFPVRNEEGEIIRYAGFVTDITRQVLTSMKLRETSERYTAVLKHNPMLVSEFDLEGRYLLVNDAITELYGRQEEELIGKRFGELLPPDTASLFEERIEKIKETGQAMTVEDRLELEDETVFFSTTLFPLIGSRGELQSIGSIAHNITEIRLANEALAKSEEKFRQITESMGEVFWLRSGDNARVLYVNPAYEKVFGRSCQSLYEKPNSFMDSMHEEDRQTVIDNFVLFEKTGEFDMEYRIVTPEGRIKWIRAQSFPVYDKEGNVSRTTGVASDITKRKTVEIALSKAKEKAEESDRLKSAFLATISHELRTPLNHILGFSSIIESSAPDDDTREFASIIHDSGKKFLSMIEDIFDLALAEQGEVKMREQTFRLADLFLETKNSLEETLSESGKNDSIDLVFKPDGKLLQSYIKSDRYKISQVLTNLFRNAVKFTHSGSIEYGFTVENENKLVFYLKDTGIGIPSDKCDIIFDFFRQVDDSHTRHFEGLGIGLAISRKIARTMNGELSVNSVEGEGSTFYFTIPFKGGKKASEIPAARDKTAERLILEDKTILVAEDDRHAMAMVSVLLKPSRAKIIQAVNGREAIEACAANPEIDLVLMDLKMPEMDGLTATRHIKSSRPDLPVLALTAYGLVKDRQRAMEAGCDVVIPKPVDHELLMYNIRKFLDKSGEDQ